VIKRLFRGVKNKIKWFIGTDAEVVNTSEVQIKEETFIKHLNY
jgi:hypothetical protein